MPRPQSWPPRVYTHKASGRDRVRINGRDIWLGPTGTAESRQRYLELLARVEGNGRAFDRPPPSMTVAEVCDWWLRVMPNYYPPPSREPKSFRAALAPLVKGFGLIPATEFGPKKFRELQMLYAAKGWCRNTINRQSVRVKTMFRRAAAEEVLPASVWDGLRAAGAVPIRTPGVRVTPGRKPATWQMVKLVLRHCHRVVGAMLLVQWFAGMRTGEVVQMRAEDIDTGGDVWLYRPRQHKGTWRGQERVVALGPKAQRVLRRWLRLAAPGAYLFRPADAPFATNRSDGGAYKVQHYGRAVRRAADAAGVDLCPYMLRHGFRVAAGVAAGAEAARAALGQDSIDSTQLYGRLDREQAQVVARLIG